VGRLKAAPTALGPGGRGVSGGSGNLACVISVYCLGPPGDRSIRRQQHMTSIRLALRRLASAPFVTLVAILSLALGIGANAAIFSLFNQMLLRPLPVPAPHELVNLSAPGPKPGSQSCNQAGSCEDVFSYPMFRDLQRTQAVFTDVAAHRLFGANLSYKSQTLNGEGVLVSGSYFPVLGVQPALGRLLSAHDDQAIGESLVVVLSHAYWVNRFGGAETVLNDTLVVNGHHLTIVGVTPEGFDGTTLGARPQVYVPITLRGLMNPGFTQFDNRRTYWAYLFARLRDGVTVDQARAQLNVEYRAILHEVEAPLQTGMSDQTMERFRAKELGVEEGARGQSSVDREARTPLILLLSVTGLVLLIACANIANLLLVRGAARASEMAIRLSIGANRRQLIGQLLTESIVLAICGGLAGLVVARWTLDVILGMLPAEAADTLQFQVDGTVLLFAAAVTLTTGLLFGLFPAWHTTRPDLLPTLKGQAGQPGGGRSAQWFRTTLATTQIAISMALLVCAGLFTKSLLNVSRVDLGIDIENLVTFSISPELNGYTPERSKGLFERLEDELLAQPGVTAVAASLVPAIAGSNWGSSVSVEGFEAGPDTDTHSNYNEVGPEYFRTMGIPILAGREFTRADRQDGPKVAIVNEAFARKFNLGRDAVGKRIGTGTGNAATLDIEIVGLARDAKYSEVKGAIRPVFFRPYRQNERVGYINFYVRTTGSSDHLIRRVPGVVAGLDPDLPVVDLRTMPQQVRQNVFLDRMVSTLSAGFATLATLLAAIGLYGVLAYTVAQRTREIGLRMALGAAPGRVRLMILRQVAGMTAVGAVIGLAAALWAGRAAQALLYELEGHDPVVLGVSVALLAVVALGAGFIPAHRASKVDPMLALRYE
jgi:predicted permease